MTPEDEEIIKLQPQDSSKSARRSSRIGEIKKNNRLDSLANSTRLDRRPALKTIEEEPESQPAPTSNEADSGKKQRRFHEGKSIEYNIDQILHNDSYVTQVAESAWGAQKKNFPVGWVISVVVVCLVSLSYMLYLLADSHNSEEEIAVVNKIVSAQSETEISTAKTLVKSIDATVRGYLTATTIEEKLRYVRQPEAMRARMEYFYQTHPLTPLFCRNVTDYQPLAISTKSLWRVVAVIDDKRAEGLLLEQISDTETKIDWESHVNYQPMDWVEYVQKKPITAMAFRVRPELSARFIGEFGNENQWACYRLREKSSEKSLFGYVTRNSTAHLSIEQGIANGSKVMILRLQFANAIKVADSVVIDKVISSEIYRPGPPTSIND